MNFQGAKRVSGVIRKELDDLWRAVEQRTPMPHGEQILSRTSKGFSVQGGGGSGGAAAKPIEKSSATHALWVGNVDGTKTTLNLNQDIDLFVKVSNPDGGALVSVHINPPDYLETMPTGGANLNGVHVWPTYSDGDRIIFMGTPELNLQAANDWFLGSTATDLNIDSRLWYADFTGCSYNSVTFQYTTESFSMPFK